MPRPPSKIPLRRVHMLVPVTTWNWLIEESSTLGVSVTEFVKRLIDEKRLQPPKKG